MTNPTNTDLADALREIANTLPLGSALVVRLAADRLTTEADTDGWIEWDASTTDSMDGPRLASDTVVEVRFAYDRRTGTGSVEWFRDGIGCNNWSHPDPRYAIAAYRVLP